MTGSLRRREPHVYPVRTGLGGRVQRWVREGPLTKAQGLVPEADAVVEIQGPGPDGPTVHLRTDALGRFGLALAPGDYRVRSGRRRQKARVEEGRVTEVELN